MEVSTRVGQSIEIRIFGKVDSIEECIEIKEEILQHIEQNLPFVIYFIDSSIIHSNLLGYLLKLRQNDNKEISIIVSNTRIYNFFKNIAFDNFFDIKIKEYE